MKNIVFASHNVHKFRECQKMLADQGLVLVTQAAFSVPAVVESGLTFVENAIIKARQAASYTGLASIADDSGLEVEALQGKPGIYSARYAGEKATDAENNARLLQDLAAVPKVSRHARYQCVMVFLRHADDPTPVIAQGTWEGEILFASQGEEGFGYDPLFYLPQLQCSVAELPLAEKNRLSHRGQALQALCRQLKGSYLGHGS